MLFSVHFKILVVIRHSPHSLSLGSITSVLPVSGFAYS